MPDRCTPSLWTQRRATAPSRPTRHARCYRWFPIAHSLSRSDCVVLLSARNPRKRERPTSPDSPVTPAVKVPLRAGAPLSSASAPSSGEKHSSDVTVPAPVRAALQDSDMRFAPISSSDRFWRGAIKVRAFTLTDTGRIQSLRTCVALWNAPRASAFASNRDGRGWSGARTSGVLRRRYRLARAHYPSRRAGLVRRQSASGRSARSIRAASWVLP